MSDLDFHGLCKRAMGRGEPARVFSPDVPVWSEIAVRAAILQVVQAIIEANRDTEAQG